LVPAHRVLIAAEIRNLLEPTQLTDFDVTWLAANDPTPKGDWVAIVPLLTRWVGGTELKSLPHLRIVANVAVGYNNVDVVAAEMRKVIVTNTPGVLTEATADLTWALILATARRLVEAADLVRSGKWTGWHPEQLLGLELRGRTLGLFGAGRIGQAVGRRAVPFGLRILYAARTAKPEFEQATGATRVGTSELLAGETGDKAAASDFAACFELAQDRQEFAPRRSERFANEQIAQQNTPAKE